MPMNPLYEFQKPASAQLVRALTHGQEEHGYPGCVDMSDVGVGKTAIDLAAMLEIGRKPVVLCPVAGITGWQKMFSIFNAEPAYLGSWESVKLGFRESVVRRNGDSFTWRNAGEIGLILDESQACKSDVSLAAACIDGAIAQHIPIICASATLASSPVELRIAGQVTGLHKGGHDWPRFLAANGCRWDEEEQRWIWNRKAHLLEQIHYTLIPQRGCRVTKAMMGDRPGTTIQLLPIECEDGERIAREWQQALDQLKRMESQNYPKYAILATRRKVRMRLWQESEMALVPHIAARVKQDLDNGCSALVFFGFTKSREAMGRLLNTRAGFYGGQNANRRAHYEREFQANRIRILLSNIGAGGSSVSLHDTTGEFPRVSYIFPSDSAVKMGQAPGRTDRAGGKSHAMVWIPCVAGTLSEAMVKTTSRKLLAMSALNDGSTITT